MHDRPCGTNAGYARHRYDNEPVCHPCHEAHRQYETARCIRSGKTAAINVPHAALADLYLEASIAAQKRFEDAIGVTVLDAIVAYTEALEATSEAA